MKGRLPDGIGDQEIKQLSLEIEEAAHTSSSHIQDPVARKQAYYKAASKLLLEAVLDHCPPDADPTACISLPQPQLEPQSALSSHVARPPMDPRQALSRYPAHTTPDLAPAVHAIGQLRAAESSLHARPRELHSVGCVLMSHLGLVMLQVQCHLPLCGPYRGAYHAPGAIRSAAISLGRVHSPGGRSGLVHGQQSRLRQDELLDGLCHP